MGRIAITSKNVLKTLDSAREEWGGMNQAHYKLMACAWRCVLILRKNKKELHEFLQMAKPTKKGKTGNIADAVMGYVMRAKTESEKKMAWKRSRGLQFLHEQGIKTNRIAKEIEARGGIEELCKEAIKQTPRRRPNPARDKHEKDSSSISTKKISTKSQRVRLAEKADGSKEEPEHTNDQALKIELGIKLSDRDELFEMPKGAKARLTVRRVDHPHGVHFKVTGIKELVAKPDPQSW